MSRALPILLIMAGLAGMPPAVSAGPPAKRPQATSRARSMRAAADKRASSTNRADEVETVNPGVFLLRDPLVQAELELSVAQKSAAAELAAEFNEAIWAFRDASVDSQPAVQEARRLNALIEPRLEELLQAEQRQRLAGIILQVQGNDALLRWAIVQKLSLGRDQQQTIGKLLETARKAAARLSTEAAGDHLTERSRRLEKMQLDLQRDVQAVLTQKQRELLEKLRGRPIALSKLEPLSAEAPELRGATDWINSEPLTLRKLRGKVVALHFWTFG